ncbi:hypothetical protein JOL62DRAFT_560005 [Phyllosticta paracitricarpa]|uniref:Uncharacterized protein n=1 Tax=Phyllosticta paracitricarpa TaxID=2016321 RepID=A0ABR1MXV8_9PEZI
MAFACHFGELRHEGLLRRSRATLRFESTLALVSSLTQCAHIRPSSRSSVVWHIVCSPTTLFQSPYFSDAIRNGHGEGFCSCNVRKMSHPVCSGSRECQSVESCIFWLSWQALLSWRTSLSALGDVSMSASRTPTRLLVLPYEMDVFLAKPDSVKLRHLESRLAAFHRQLLGLEESLPKLEKGGADVASAKAYGAKAFLHDSELGFSDVFDVPHESWMLTGALALAARPNIDLTLSSAASIIRATRLTLWIDPNYIDSLYSSGWRGWQGGRTDGRIARLWFKIIRVVGVVTFPVRFRSGADARFCEVCDVKKNEHYDAVRSGGADGGRARSPSPPRLDFTSTATGGPQRPNFDAGDKTQLISFVRPHQPVTCLPPSLGLLGPAQARSRCEATDEERMLHGKPMQQQT